MSFQAGAPDGSATEAKAAGRWVTAMIAFLGREVLGEGRLTASGSRYVSTSPSAAPGKGTSLKTAPGLLRAAAEGRLGTDDRGHRLALVRDEGTHVHECLDVRVAGLRW